MSLAIQHRPAAQRLPMAAPRSPRQLLTTFVRSHLTFLEGVSHEREARARAAECQGLLRALDREGRSEEELHLATLALLGMLSWTFAWYGPDRRGNPGRLTERVLSMFLDGFSRDAVTPNPNAPVAAWPMSCDDVDDV